MGTHLNYSGFIVAGLGFFLTRFTVTLAIDETPVQFYLAGVVPLALGLGLAAFGVALVVADIDRSLVRTTALWCVIGFSTMLVLVVLTLLGSTSGSLDLTAARSQTYLSNFLIGGSIGGTLTGLYASRNRRQRGELRQQANRLVTLNRILRHEILNAVTAIRGWAKVDPNENPDAMTVIDERSEHIEQTIEEIKYLTERTGTERSARTPINLDLSLTESVETIADRHPEADISVESIPDGLRVYANQRLSRVFTHLLENAIVHGDDDTPTVTVSIDPTTVTVSVEDDGPGLPESQQTLLEAGDIAEFDDPTVGFGLNVVRLLVESYAGTIRTAVNDEGTTVAVTLPRELSARAEQQPNRAALTGVRPALPHLIVTTAVAIFAGVPYGIVSNLLGEGGGAVAAIGVFYGTPNLVVGWLTHEFHSIVFGFMYVGVLSIALERYRNAFLTYLGVALGWAVVVWAVAASFIAPFWLQLLDIPADVPSFSYRLFWSHIAWGLSLGLLTPLGYRYVNPWLRRLGQRSKDAIRSVRS